MGSFVMSIPLDPRSGRMREDRVVAAQWNTEARKVKRRSVTARSRE